MHHKTYMEALNLYHSVLPYRRNRQKVRGYQNKISTGTPHVIYRSYRPCSQR